ncbi:MAG: ABC transporter permease [Actinobacteria bacterium]|nr:ABC transporter permease [Actinomycetota bacterium]
MKTVIKKYVKRSVLQLSIFAVVVIMFLIFIILSPETFLSYNIYYAFMSTIPFTAILAISITFIIILGEIDLSFASVVGLCAFIYALVFKYVGNVYIGLICSLLVGAIAGFLNGLFVLKVRIPSLIITLGMSFFWRGLVYIISGGIGLSLVNTKPSVWYKLLVGRIAGVIPAQAVWLVLITIFFAVILNYHRFGNHILFAGDNIESARMMGINVDRVKFTCFTQLGIVSALVGMISSSEIVYVYPTAGSGYAVFIGGTSVYGGRGTIFGTLMGAIIIGSLEAGILSAGVEGFWIEFVYGIVIVVSLTLYSYLTRAGILRKLI